MFLPQPEPPNAPPVGHLRHGHYSSSLCSHVPSCVPYRMGHPCCCDNIHVVPLLVSRPFMLMTPIIVSNSLPWTLGSSTWRPVINISTFICCFHCPFILFSPSVLNFFSLIRIRLTCRDLWEYHLVRCHPRRPRRKPPPGMRDRVMQTESMTGWAMMREESMASMGTSTFIFVCLFLFFPPCRLRYDDLFCPLLSNTVLCFPFIISSSPSLTRRLLPPPPRPHFPFVLFCLQ